MNILFLGGNSKRHDAWIVDMARQLSAPFDNAIVHRYRHWDTGEELADIIYELQQITRKTEGFGPYIIFAKSIGTLIALKGIYEGVLAPKACVFLGLPVLSARDMDLPLRKWLASADVPMYFLHNSNDPYGSAEKLKGLLDSANATSDITELQDNTHDYLDTEIMRQLLAKASQ